MGAATISTVSAEDFGSDANVAPLEDLIMPTVPHTAPAVRAVPVAFGQTAPRRGNGTTPTTPKSSRGRYAQQRRQHRRVGAKLRASLRYEMPSPSFDSSQLRTKIQTLGVQTDQNKHGQDGIQNGLAPVVVCARTTLEA